jgi:hypothetical protein
MLKKTKPYKIPKVIQNALNCSGTFQWTAAYGSKKSFDKACAKLSKAEKALIRWCKANDRKLAKLRDINNYGNLGCHHEPPDLRGLPL